MLKRNKTKRNHRNENKSMDWENLTYYMVEHIRMIKRDSEEWVKSGHEEQGITR